MIFRRRDIFAGALLGSLPVPRLMALAMAKERLVITGFELFHVKVSARGNWLFVKLKTDKGLTGLGEASHGLIGVGIAPANADAPVLKLIPEFFQMVRGMSPFDVEAYRGRGWMKAKQGGRPATTAFSAIEQAMWDLAGKALDAPVYDLLGGKVRDELEVYANINRATNGDRSPEAFARNARLVVEDGFQAVKAAPFDSVRTLSHPAEEVWADIENGIACVAAIRKAVGSGVKVLIDCHSHFDRDLAITVAKRLEPMNLFWYEEPVDPVQTEDTAAIKRNIKQPLSGCEVFFGAEAFAPLLLNRALDVIMPDVKHCGGILEARNIAALARLHGNTAVSPHNPSGPVATAASIQICAGISNFNILEHAWREVPWSHDLVTPREEFHGGKIRVPNTAGIGVVLNERVVMEHAV